MWGTSNLLVHLPHSEGFVLCVFPPLFCRPSLCYGYGATWQWRRMCRKSFLSTKETYLCQTLLQKSSMCVRIHRVCCGYGVTWQCSLDLREVHVFYSHTHTHAHTHTHIQTLVWGTSNLLVHLPHSGWFVYFRFVLSLLLSLCAYSSCDMLRYVVTYRKRTYSSRDMILLCAYSTK